MEGGKEGALKYREVSRRQEFQSAEGKGEPHQTFPEEKSGVYDFQA